MADLEDETTSVDKEIKILVSQIHSWKKECEKRDKEINRLRSIIINSHEALDKLESQIDTLKMLSGEPIPEVETGSSTEEGG